MKKGLNRPKDKGEAALENTSPGAPRAVGMGGFGAASGFGQPPESVAPVADDKSVMSPSEAELERIKHEKDAAKKALKASQRKNDPELVAYARELRERWQEHVGANPMMIEDKCRGRYAVGRLLNAHCDKKSSVQDDVSVADVKRLPRVA